MAIRIGGPPPLRRPPRLMRGRMTVAGSSASSDLERAAGVTPIASLAEYVQKCAAPPRFARRGRESWGSSLGRCLYHIARDPRRHYMYSASYLIYVVRTGPSAPLRSPPWLVATSCSFPGPPTCPTASSAP